MKYFKNACCQCGKILKRLKKMRMPLCKGCVEYFKEMDQKE